MRALGDRKLKQVRGQTTGVQRGSHSFGEVRVLKLVDRDVDGHTQLLRIAGRPLRRVGTGAVQRPCPHRHDETRLFGQGNEVTRRDAPEFVIVPAHQSFSTDRAPGEKSELGW